jgi:hypothetical protein
MLVVAINFKLLAFGTFAGAVSNAASSTTTDGETGVITVDSVNLSIFFELVGVSLPQLIIIVFDTRMSGEAPAVCFLFLGTPPHWRLSAASGHSYFGCVCKDVVPGWARSGIVR